MASWPSRIRTCSGEKRSFHRFLVLKSLVLTENTQLLIGSDSALTQVLQCPYSMLKHFTQASCFISSVVYVIIQMLQNHTSVQSPLVACDKASFLLPLNAQRLTGFLLQEGLMRLLLKKGGRLPRPCFYLPQKFLHCTTART